MACWIKTALFEQGVASCGLLRFPIKGSSVRLDEELAEMDI